jgi:tetratricopeptide (TPR) repeat protein
MSLFGRLFGGVKAMEEQKRGEQLFAENRFFDAKNAFEAAASASDASEGLKKTCAERIDACSDGLARGHMAQADEHLAHGDLVHARAALRDAMEVAGTPAVRREAEVKLERAERSDARANAEETEGPSDDERILLLAAQWEEEQQDEYDAYGEPFRAALVMMEKGENEAARTALEALLAEYKDEEPVYLYLEVARARSRCEDDEATGKALRTFLKRVPEEDRSEARVNAYVALSQIAEKAGDEEKAIKQLNKAIEAMSDDPRPYLNLGVYLRAKGHADEAIELLDLAIDHMDEDRPSWLAYQELGLAHRDAGNEAKAIDLLEKVLRHFVQRGVTDFPPSAALPLAELHEKKNDLARAADLYASLARGTDRVNHLAYHLAAGRVLAKLDLVDEARRMYTRAAALAEGDATATAAVEAEIAKLDE